MALALNNAQGELSPLEIGLHSLGSPLGVREYAKALGISHTGHIFQRQAAEVVTHVTTDQKAPSEYSDKTRHLSEIHAAPRWLWPALVAGLVEDGWTVEDARRGAGKRFRVGRHLGGSPNPK
jgi:hypothetical protein